ncbi:hypothetical protein XH99_17545 [Bradyrhizobium nanningense]|uniref:Uncharacterized protein n=1 Tax=Bradyrhizobium nanningense TaxID=1325118 RepID=A0A4Q0S679_9BRAD|nr:hypothetical protein [Bradyrhizobium nanningense]RXH22498.1 hypothetical protein XH84_34925 [Bradyrhizobium nanningense]RXH26932.1 hypothetical protein XH99_17545 [Bradyrhizobium nanningense]
MKTLLTTSAVAVLLAATSPVLAQKSITGGSAGSAAVGGTSASTVGTGGTSTSATGSTGSSIATGGSAAAVNGKTQTGVSMNKGNGPVLNSNARAQAHEGGTFSRSHTRTQVKAGEEVGSTTKTMSHVPGSKPTMSTTSTTSR